jgi:predicted deacetylase
MEAVVEANFDLFFKMSKNIYREEETQKTLEKKKEKFKAMSVHTFNALEELKNKNLFDEASKKDTVDELKEFYISKIKESQNRLNKEIEFVRLYQEVRKY